MLYGHILLVLYITFLLLYHMHICVLTRLGIEEIPSMESGILAEYYGMLGFQPAGTPKLLDQF